MYQPVDRDKMTRRSPALDTGGFGSELSGAVMSFWLEEPCGSVCKMFQKDSR